MRFYCYIGYRFSHPWFAVIACSFVCALTVESFLVYDAHTWFPGKHEVHIASALDTFHTAFYGVRIG